MLDKIVSTSISTIQQFEFANQVSQMHPLISLPHNWCPTSGMFVKVNFDAAIFDDINCLCGCGH